MQTSESLVPVGQLHGAACLDVVMPVPVVPDEFLAHMAHNMRPGMQAVWLRDVPWGAQDLDRALMLMMSDERWHGLHVMALRSVAAEKWTSVQISWIGDASSLTAEPTSAEKIREDAHVLPFRPALDELVLVDPHRLNLSVSVLDEVFTAFDPTVAAWVYVTDPATADAAAAVLPRCASPWGLRLRGKGTI